MNIGLFNNDDGVPVGKSCKTEGYQCPHLTSDPWWICTMYEVEIDGMSFERCQQCVLEYGILRLAVDGGDK